MSESSVSPAGSKRMLVNFWTYVSSGTPYCNAIEIAIEKASITPASVEPCLPSLRNTSPSPLSGYEPAVMYPSAPPTENDVVRDGRDFGSRRRVGRYSTTFSTDCAVVPAFALSTDKGCPTLQLSR